MVALEQALQRQEHATTQLVLGDQICDFQQRTYIMGILNVTPDSFSDGGLYLQPEQAIKHAETMLAAGPILSTWVDNRPAPEPCLSPPRWSRNVLYR